ncbi:MAG TPA: prolipoprotein diacylglyceryl transferase family protein [Saprospiraceae bacterium]|nr:prolipoprotein diacylglyceryl transferase family protein [Saprospiraceae bacterium]
MYPDVSYLLHDIFGTQPDNWLSVFKIYGIFLFLGIYIASKVFEREINNKLGILFKGGAEKVLPHNFRDNILLIASLSGIIGSKVIVLIEDYTVFFNNNIYDAVFKKTGISFYGGFLGAAFTLIFYFRKEKINLLPALDAAAPAVLIGYSLGRLGCHFSGDGDWGVVSNVQPSWWFLPDWVWGFDFPHNVANKGTWIEDCTFRYCKILEQPVFPTSLYESISCFALFLLILMVKSCFSKLDGAIFSIYLILGGFERFAIEFIRVNEKYKFEDLWLSQAQFISIVLVALGSLLLLYITYSFKNKRMVGSQNSL